MTTVKASVSEGHPTLVRFLHWGTALTIAVSVSAILLRETVEHKALRSALLELHRQLGMLVMLAIVARIAFRLAVGLRSHASDIGAALRVAASVAHWLMYAVLASVTLLGWALCNAHAVHLRLLGLLALPNIIAADSELADTLNDYHVWGAWVLLGFVATHVLAALWHHFVRRDAVLKAMLPRLPLRSN
jgi:cytochrome b561